VDNLLLRMMSSYSNIPAEESSIAFVDSIYGLGVGVAVTAGAATLPGVVVLAGGVSVPAITFRHVSMLVS